MPSITLNVLRMAPRVGAEKDEPEGSRYIQLSETLVNLMIAELTKENEDAKR